MKVDCYEIAGYDLQTRPNAACTSWRLVCRVKTEEEALKWLENVLKGDRGAYLYRVIRKEFLIACDD